MRTGIAWLTAVVTACAWTAVPDVWAQRAGQRASPVLRLLARDPDVRTRAQAALTLGSIQPPGARAALVSALDDPAPAVRAASASALAALGEREALDALQSHRGDTDNDVRDAVAHALGTLATAPDWSTARYAVSTDGVNDAAESDPEHVATLREAIGPALREQPGVVPVPGGLPPAALARLRAGRLAVFGLQGNVQAIQRAVTQGDATVRAQVAMVLVDGRNNGIVGMLTGAGTVRHPGDVTPAEARALDALAIRAAVGGALRNLAASLETLPR